MYRVIVMGGYPYFENCYEFEFLTKKEAKQSFNEWKEKVKNNNTRYAIGLYKNGKLKKAYIKNGWWIDVIIK